MIEGDDLGKGENKFTTTVLVKLTSFVINSILMFVLGLRLSKKPDLQNVSCFVKRKFRRTSFLLPLPKLLLAVQRLGHFPVQVSGIKMCITVTCLHYDRIMIDV